MGFKISRFVRKVAPAAIGFVTGGPVGAGAALLSQQRASAAARAQRTRTVSSIPGSGMQAMGFSGASAGATGVGVDIWQETAAYATPSQLGVGAALYGAPGMIGAGLAARFQGKRGAGMATQQEVAALDPGVRAGLIALIERVLGMLLDGSPDQSIRNEVRGSGLGTLFRKFWASGLTSLVDVPIPGRQGEYVLAGSDKVLLSNELERLFSYRKRASRRTFLTKSGESALRRATETVKLLRAGEKAVKQVKGRFLKGGGRS